MPVRPEYDSAFPSQQRIADALLVYIRTNGGRDAMVSCDETYGPLADLFGLSPQLRRLTRSEYYENDTHSGLAWPNLVQWGRRQLKDQGCLAPSAHGTWRLSESGMHAADRHVSGRRQRARPMSDR